MHPHPLYLLKTSQHKLDQQSSDDNVSKLPVSTCIVAGNDKMILV